MKRALRILLLIIIFIAAVIFFFFLFNRGTKTEETFEEQAELPVVYMLQDGQWINELHGYRTEMSEVSMRDTILQMPEDDTLHLLIDTKSEVRSVSYEIISLDGSSEVARGKGSVSESEEGYEASILLTDNLAQGVDNILVLCLDVDGLRRQERNSVGLLPHQQRKQQHKQYDPFHRRLPFFFYAQAYAGCARG